MDAIAEPEIAQLRVGTDILLEGNSSSPHLTEICSRIPTTNTVPQWSADFTGGFVTPETEEWEAAVLDSTKRRSVRQRKRVYSSRYLDPNHLAELMSVLPPGFELRRFDETIAEELGIDMA